MTEKEQNRSKVKIWLSCHRESAPYVNEAIEAVMQADVVSQLLQGSQADRDMAQRANEYCELLTQYYVWQNIGKTDADMLGFGHYRRYFAFRDGEQKDRDNVIRTDYRGDSAEKFGFDSAEKIAEELQNFDVIAPQTVRFYKNTVREQYAQGEFLHSEDLKTVEGIIAEQYPQYKNACQEYLNGREFYMCNMFILRKNLFLKYSEWLFSVLQEYYARHNPHNFGYSSAELRAAGHLGERLFGIYLTYLKEQGQYRIGYRPIVVFQNIGGKDKKSLADRLFPYGTRRREWLKRLCFRGKRKK